MVHIYLVFDKIFKCYHVNCSHLASPSSSLVLKALYIISDGLHFKIYQVYAEASSPHVVNTAWAMLALIYAGQVDIPHIVTFGA